MYIKYAVGKIDLKTRNIEFFRGWDYETNKPLFTKDPVEGLLYRTKKSALNEVIYTEEFVDRKKMILKPVRISISCEVTMED